MGKTRAYYQEMYHQAFEPFSAHSGTNYPTSQGELDFHRRDRFPSRNKGPFVSERQVTHNMITQNEKGKKLGSREGAALRRLIHAVENYNDGYPYGPDLAIKVFDDLDIVFFGGLLRNNVLVTWTNCQWDDNFACNSAGCSYGYTLNRHSSGGQAYIRLNAKKLFNDARSCPFQAMMCTLLHEMCHAIDFVRCPGATADGGDGAGHDDHFATRISVVHERAMRVLGLRAIDDWEDYVQHHYVRLESGKGAVWSCGQSTRHGGGSRYCGGTTHGGQSTRCGGGSTYGGGTTHGGHGGRGNYHSTAAPMRSIRDDRTVRGSGSSIGRSGGRTSRDRGSRINADTQEVVVGCNVM